MSNIDWKTKLTSRKFWVTVIGFVVPLLVAFGMTDNQAAEVASIIMAGANMIAYIIGEGLVDAARIKAQGVDANQLREVTKMIDGSK